MKIQFAEMQTPDGIRSAYIALPDGVYDENWKSCCITVLREDDKEESVVEFIEKAGLQHIVDKELSVIGFPNPIGGKWNYDGGDEMTADEKFVSAFSSSALPSGRYSNAWRVMGDVHYLVGIGTGASLVNVLAAVHPTNSLAAAICTVGGEMPAKALEHATYSPVPAYVLDGDADYFIRANDSAPLGNGKYACDYNGLQKVWVSDKKELDLEAGRIMWDEFFHITRRVNSSVWGDVDRRIIPEECGFEWHTLDTCLGDNNGLAHSWIEHCPKAVKADPDTKVPLMIFSHGMSDNPLKAADMIKFHELGEREGFITVYTFASNRYSWNLSCAPEKLDDMAYYEALIKYLKKKYPVDETRVYLSGFSNGAGMSMVFAMLHPELIAAICPVDSTFPYAAMGHFRPAGGSPYITPVGEQPSGGFRPPKSDPEQNLSPLRRALAKQQEKQLYLPVMYFYGTRESEYPIKSGCNQELSYNFWKEFNNIERAATDDDLEPAVGVAGQEVEEIYPDPAHPDHLYTRNTFFADSDKAKDYYNFMLMHGKAHDVHPAEREMGWAFVSRFARNADGSLTDNKE